jgi:hypothetical protein
MTCATRHHAHARTHAPQHMVAACCAACGGGAMARGGARQRWQRTRAAAFGGRVPFCARGGGVHARAAPPPLPRRVPRPPRAHVSWLRVARCGAAAGGAAAAGAAVAARSARPPVPFSANCCAAAAAARRRRAARCAAPRRLLFAARTRAACGCRSAHTHAPPPPLRPSFPLPLPCVTPPIRPPTPLLCCAVRVVLLLLCAQGGGTPLHFAAAYGHASVVTLLCERGANKEAKDYVRTRCNTWPRAHCTARGGGGAAAARASAFCVRM